MFRRWEQFLVPDVVGARRVVIVITIIPRNDRRDTTAIVLPLLLIIMVVLVLVLLLMVYSSGSAAARAAVRGSLVLPCCFFIGDVKNIMPCSGRGLDAEKNEKLCPGNISFV